MRVTAFRGCKNDCKRCNTPVLPVLLMLKNILHRFLTCAHFEARPDDGKVQARSVGPRVSPRAEEGLLACLLWLPRLLPAEQRVALGHEAGDARLWVRWVWVYEVENGVVGSESGLGERLGAMGGQA